MKPLFGVNSSDDGSEGFAVEKFAIRTISEEKSQELSQKSEGINQVVNEGTLPLALEIAKYVFGGIAVVIFFLFLGRLDDNDFWSVLEDLKWFVAGGALSGLLCVAIMVAARLKAKRAHREGDLGNKLDDLMASIDSIYAELGVPKTAYDVDVLIFEYKYVDGRPEPKATFLEPPMFLALEAKMFVEGDSLCIGDLESVYAFKLEELKRIETVKKRGALPEWKKTTHHNKGEYKKYKMTTDSAGRVFFKPHYILVGERDGEEYGIYFPCYDIDALERLTGLNAQE